MHCYRLWDMHPLVVGWWSCTATMGGGTSLHSCLPSLAEKMSTWPEEGGGSPCGILPPKGTHIVPPYLPGFHLLMDCGEEGYANQRSSLPLASVGCLSLAMPPFAKRTRSRVQGRSKSRIENSRGESQIGLEGIGFRGGETMSKSCGAKRNHIARLPPPHTPSYFSCLPCATHDKGGVSTI